MLPYSLGVQLGLDWNAHNLRIRLTGTLAQVEARGILVEATVGQLAPVQLVLAWAASDQVQFVLGQFNFFQVFDVSFFRSRGLFEIRLASPDQSGDDQGIVRPNSSPDCAEGAEGSR